MLAEIAWDVSARGSAGPDRADLRVRALALAEQARATFAEAGDDVADQRAEVDAWLEQHRR